LRADGACYTLKAMYKNVAASAARFHWGSKVGVGVAGTFKLDDIDREVYERRKAQRRFDLGDLIRAAGLSVDATASWRVECLAAARSEFGRIPEKQFKAILAAVVKLWQSPEEKTQQNRFNEQLRRFKTNSYRISFCIQLPSQVIVFRVVADKRNEWGTRDESSRTRDIRLSAGWNLQGPTSHIKPGK
jgi:mRNA-degrading endonuclease RelE of RelBE toxin-antitoxin system